MQVLPKDFYKVMCSFTVILRSAFFVILRSASFVILRSTFFVILRSTFFVILRSAATKDLIKILRVSSPDSVRAERVPLARSAAQNDIWGAQNDIWAAQNDIWGAQNDI